MEKEIEDILWIEGLKNALKFNGTASAKAVMGKLMKERPELRKLGKEMKSAVATVMDQVNQLDLETQEKKLLVLDPHALDEEEKKGPEEKQLPELEGAEKGKVVMRLAPYPSGALHIGNARMIVLNDEYVKKYNGKLLLVFDDTIGTTLEKINDPKAKFVIPEAYDLIPEGLDWLGVKYHETHYKSDRVELYQDEAGKLVAKGDAYVCTCDAQDFRDNYKKTGKECPCRSKTIEYHQEMYDQMKEGKIAEGAAVVRLKTGMDQKDPAMRDHIIMRISDAPHPRIGTKVRLWPVLEWSWGLDDHYLGVTHIIRGIDLRKEGEVEKFIWDLYGWKQSHITLYGRLKFDDEFKLSKTLARQQIQAGVYEGWSDPRTWSLQSLRERGIQTEAVREALLDLGLSKRGIIFDKDWIYSKNTKIVDPIANRYWFVENPREVIVSDVPMDEFTATPLINPGLPDKGTREIPLGIQNHQIKFHMAEEDFHPFTNEKGKVIYEAPKEGDIFRIKDVFNIEVKSLDTPMQATFHSLEKMKDVRKIQVVPDYQSVKVRVLQPTGNVTVGLGEGNLRNLNTGDIIQFIRYGFVNIRKVSDNEVYGYYTNN